MKLFITSTVFIMSRESIENSNDDRDYTVNINEQRMQVHNREQ